MYLKLYIANLDPPLFSLSTHQVSKLGDKLTIVLEPENDILGYRDTVFKTYKPTLKLEKSFKKVPNFCINEF